MRTYKIAETVEREITERQALDIVEANRQDQLSPRFPLGAYVRVVKEDTVYTRYAGVVTDVTIPENCAGHRYTVSLFFNSRVVDAKLYESDLEEILASQLVA